MLQDCGSYTLRPVVKPDQVLSTMSDPPSPINDFGFIQLSSAAVYEYEPLPGVDYIRRVRLHPGPFEDAVVVSLEVVPFSEDERPEYEALSYVWGSPDQPDIVRVDETYGLTISATRNLATALKYLRRTDEPRTLWIDALCINQTDDVEKGPQVAMMGDIYRHATRVVVWLGTEADNSDMILAKMAYLGSQIQVDFAGKVEISLAEGATELGLADPSKPVYFWVQEFDALVQLFLRPWFSRLWIRQEIHLASPAAVITCGHSQVPWPVFLRAFALIIHQQIQVVDTKGPITEDSEPAVLDRVETLLHQYNQRQVALVGFVSAGSGAAILSDLRKSFGFSDCYDPRDRVYGVLSLLPDYLREGIVPDYTKPFGDVYKDAILQYLRMTSDLSVLGSCEFATGSEIPSWVPDWSRKSTSGSIIQGQHASSQIASWYELHADDMLRVAGVLVGTIQYHDAVQMQLGWSNVKRYEEIRRLLIGMVHPEKTITDEEKIEYVARTLLCNAFDDSLEPPDRWLPTIEGGKSIVQKMLSDVDHIKQRDISEDEFQFLRKASVLISKQVFRTTDGQFGVAPPEAQSGDHICVLLGCDVPMVLRATQNGKFLVVGSCVMQKVNSGESLLGPLPRHIRKVQVRERSLCIWKDSHTGLLSYEDPRFESLNITLGDFPEFKGRAKLVVHPEALRKEGVDINYFDLV